jgi:hypothetical protein
MVIIHFTQAIPLLTVLFPRSQVFHLQVGAFHLEAVDDFDDGQVLFGHVAIACSNFVAVTLVLNGTLARANVPVSCGLSVLGLLKPCSEEPQFLLTIYVPHMCLI